MKNNEREKKSLFLRADRSVWVFALVLLCVFCVMLCGNLLTDKFADDFAYVFSFADGTPIRSLSGLLSSMREHYRTVNGRVIAHAFVQVFENLPKGVFAAVNAGMFTLSLALGYTLCIGRSKRSSFALLGLFAAVWIYMPAFGQVNFWLDGACNYLWAQVFALLFLLPYVHFFEKRPVFLEKGHTFKTILFALYALVMGAYSENLSGAALFMAILFLLLVRFDQKRNVPFTAALPILVGICGYAAMVFSPGELQSKNAGFSPLRLLYQAEKVVDRFHVIWVVIAALVILFFISAALHVERKRMLLAGVLTCGGIGAGLILRRAAVRPSRNQKEPAGRAVPADAADAVAVLPLPARDERRLSCAYRRCGEPGTAHTAESGRRIARRSARADRRNQIQRRGRSDLPVDLQHGILVESVHGEVLRHRADPRHGNENEIIKVKRRGYAQHTYPRRFSILVLCFPKMRSLPLCF